MWLLCFVLSLVCLLTVAIISFAISSVSRKKHNVFNILFGGIFSASLFAFIPINVFTTELSVLNAVRVFMLSVFNSMQLFTIGGDFSVIEARMILCPQWLNMYYQALVAFLFALAPLFTFGFVLSLFKNIFAYVRYIRAYFRDVYVFSELNEKSITLAVDIKKKNRKAAIVFTDVFNGNNEIMYELIEKNENIGAINFKKDMLAIEFNKHSENKNIYFFAIGINETENLNQSLKLIEKYKNRENTHLYVFSTKVESELLLATVDRGIIKVRRINEVQSLVNRVLYEKGELIFESASETTEGYKNISVVVAGMGSHGVEFIKALAWYGQMDGYKIEINAFDKDPLAKEKFVALAPELMSEKYNGVEVDGEAHYKITIHPGVDVNSETFVKKIRELKNTTFVIVALGDDDVNINTAVNLRMHFERMKIHPEIHTIVYNPQQRKALVGITNYRGQKYDIDFFGDTESSYTEGVIINSELESEALARHLKWGKEEEFWMYEYNYRSSVASAIHMKARISCGIPGAAKSEDELDEKEAGIIEALEHKRWNAYMRAEGYVYSGSKDKSTRNDLGKMHHDLVDFESLSEEEKRKDRRVGTN